MTCAQTPTVTPHTLTQHILKPIFTNKITPRYCNAHDMLADLSQPKRQTFVTFLNIF